MKKIFMIVAAALVMVSCNWEESGSNSQQKTVKLVERVTFADGGYATFNYQQGIYVNNVRFSDGVSYVLKYNDDGKVTDGRNFNITISVNDGSPDRTLKIGNGGYITTLLEGDRTVSTLEYGEYANYNLSGVTNNDLFAKSSYQWAVTGYLWLPYKQVNTWYAAGEDMSSENFLLRKTVTYAGWDTSAVNMYSYMNLLPLIVPEYVECTGLDNVVLAAIGGLRTYYLPSSVVVQTSEAASGDDAGDEGTENDDETAETAEPGVVETSRTFSYDLDADGYVETVWSGTGDNRTKLLTVTYAEPSAVSDDI